MQWRYFSISLIFKIFIDCHCFIKIWEHPNQDSLSARGVKIAEIYSQFCTNSVKPKYLVLNCTVSRFHEFFSNEEENTYIGFRNFQFSHCTVWKNSLTEIFFRQINYLVISLVKPLLSRNFCRKCMRVNFRNFHTVLYTLFVSFW